MATGITNLTDQLVHSNDTASYINAVYTVAKGHKLEFNVTRKNYDENATVTGRFSNYTNTAYILVAEDRWNSKWTTTVQYAAANAGSCSLVNTAVCSTSGMNGNKWVLAAKYDLSKRTSLFAAAGRETNGTSARYSNTEFGGKPNAGEDISHYDMGISHSF